jgi:hypothetical protein
LVRPGDRYWYHSNAAALADAIQYVHEHPEQSGRQWAGRSLVLNQFEISKNVQQLADLCSTRHRQSNDRKIFMGITHDLRMLQRVMIIALTTLAGQHLANRFLCNTDVPGPSALVSPARQLCGRDVVTSLEALDKRSCATYAEFP